MNDNKEKYKKVFAFLGITFGLLSVMGLVMFLTVWPLGNYLMATKNPWWVLIVFDGGLALLIATIFGLILGRIAKSFSISSDSESSVQE